MKTQYKYLINSRHKPTKEKNEVQEIRQSNLSDLSRKRNILVVEDQSVICDMLADLIQRQPRCTLVGRAIDGTSAVELALSSKPDIVILDIVIPGISGVEVIRRIERSLPNIKVLVFSGKQEPQLVRSLMQAGIHGFVNKSSSLVELRSAIEAIVNGNTWFSDSFAQTVKKALAHNSHRLGGIFEQLTPREREVSVLIAKSHSSKEVATLLNISIKTAENHRANLMRKLGVRDVAALVRFVVRQGLIDLNT